MHHGCLLAKGGKKAFLMGFALFLFLVKTSGLCLEVIPGKSMKKKSSDVEKIRKKEHTEIYGVDFKLKRNLNGLSHVTDSYGPCCKSLYGKIQPKVDVHYANALMFIVSQPVRSQVLLCQLETSICLTVFIRLYLRNFGTQYEVHEEHFLNSSVQ